MSEKKETHAPTPPPTTGTTTLPAAATAGAQMVAPAGVAKKVKVKALRDFAYDGFTLAAGDVGEVSEVCAKEMCDRKFEGNYSFGGERMHATAERHEIVRAVRV